ncbi:MAG TPA: hypothetical protein VFI17_06480 [Solirubrobacterales bacterium]|nr:hypothetical protein [Solirubrobacterales bacterium]
MKGYLAGACALVVALLAIGCGSSGDSSSKASNTSATISKVEYLKRADAICGRTEKEQLKLVASFPQGKPTQKAQVELIEHAGIPPLQEQAKQLGDLPAPREDAAQAEAYVVAFTKGLKKAEEDPGAMLKAPSPFAEAEALAAKVGFKVCKGA